MTKREFANRLQRRAKRAGVTISEEVASTFEAYYRLLQLWNRKINLTGLPLTELADETLDRLFIEPLVATRAILPAAHRIIDLGSGGGSPAIPIKIALPHIDLTMVEAKTRKSAFLREVVRQLGLANAHVETSRFEELLSRPDLHESMDVATIRAVRIEPRVLTIVQAFLKPMGSILLFRGASGPERPHVVPPLEWVSTQPLVDSLGSNLLVLRKSALPPAHGSLPR